MAFQECRPRFYLREIREQLKINPGDKIEVKIYSDKDMHTRTVITTVLEVYPTFVLLDFGKYRECRQIVDIYFGIRGLKRL